MLLIRQIFFYRWGSSLVISMLKGLTITSDLHLYTQDVELLFSYLNHTNSLLHPSCSRVKLQEMVRGENSAVSKNKIYLEADMLKSLLCIRGTSYVCYREPKLLNKFKKKNKKIKNLQTFLTFWCQSALTVKQLENKARDQEYPSQISFWLCYGRWLNFFVSAALSGSQAKSSLPLMDLLKFMKIPMALWRQMLLTSASCYLVFSIFHLLS